MIDFDSVGAGRAKVEDSTADMNLLQRLLDVTATMKLPVTPMDIDREVYSDSLAFRAFYVPTLTFHSVTGETIRRLHSGADNYDALKMDDYYDTYRIAAIFLAYLDVTLDVHARQGSDSVPPTLQRTPE